MTITTFYLGTNYTYDAQCGYTGAGSWPPNGGTFTQTSSNATVRAYKILSGTYGAMTAQFIWDTSSIPDGDTVTDATLRLHVYNQAIQNANTLSIVGDYHVHSIPSVAGDWIETASPSIFTAVPLSGVSINAFLEIPLTDFSGINKTGQTGVRITLSGGTPTGSNEILFTDCNSGDGNDAELVVTHSVVSGSTTKLGSLLGIG